MKNPIARFAKKFLRPLLLALTVVSAGEFRAHAAPYSATAPNNISPNFSFIARRAFTRPDGTTAAAGARVYLRDFAGRIVFLEWFAVWCPYCVAAAPQVSNNIVSYYNARGGNRYGLPVLHIAVNQESSPSYQPSTDNFVTQQGFNPVVNDYDSTSVNTVRFLFQDGGQPTFVIINGVTNSPSHQPWQILVDEQRYGQTDFAQTLAGYRAIIDTVQAAVVPPSPPIITAPRRTGTNNFEFTLTTQTNRTYRVEVSTNLINWTTLRTVNGTNAPQLFRETNAPTPRRFYRAVTP